MQRNYRFFFMFIFCATLLCLYVHGFCWLYIMRIKNSEDISIWKAMIKTPASIALIVYTFIGFWFVGGLTFFHLYLISTNQVTSTFPIHSISKFPLVLCSCYFLKFLLFHRSSFFFSLNIIFLVFNVLLCSQLMRTLDIDMNGESTRLTRGSLETS